MKCAQKELKNNNWIKMNFAWAEFKLKMNER